MFDVLIKNGMLVDGTGEPMRKADIGIKDGRIKKIGELHNERGEEEIDARGLLVCPGFVDVNNHSDTFWQIFKNPDLESLVYQGITTIVGGNCGSSLSPLITSKNIESIQKWIDLKAINVDWLRTKDFFEFMEDKKLSVNFATLSGHGTIRRGIIGDDVRSMNPKEIAYMEKIMAESLRAGSLGMSTGLIYTHARLASTEELINLAKIVKKYDGVYATHIRGEGEDLAEAIEEAIKIAKKSGAKLHISHLKAMGEKNWKEMDEALHLISDAKEKGIDVTFDVYPYTNTGSVLYALLPSWVAEGGKKIMIHRLKDPVVRAKVVEEMKESDFDWSKVEIAISPLNKSLARRNISEIARSQEKAVEETVVDVLLASEGRVIISAEILSEENVRSAISHPLSIISTNGAGYNLGHKDTGELVHPRSFGTSPKILAKYVRKEKLISWEKAVHKMTALPAEKFGIKKRGKLKEGYFADIAIFDQGKIEGPATRENPYQYARGMEFVFVNGQMVLREGKYTETRNGMIVKHS